MSKPRRIYLIRHGQSQGNVDRFVHSHTPDWKIELTQLGVEQARKAAKTLVKRLKGQGLGIYLSPYRRTVQTWIEMKAIIGVSACAWERQDPRLREQEWGNLRAYQPLAWAEIEKERDAYGSFFYRFVSGESGGDVYDRCTGFLDTLYRDFEKVDYPENVLIVTHGYTVRVLLMRWLHLTVDEFHAMHNPPNCGVYVLTLNKDDKYQLTSSPKRKCRNAELRAKVLDSTFTSATLQTNEPHSFQPLK